MNQLRYQSNFRCVDQNFPSYILTWRRRRATIVKCVHFNSRETTRRLHKDPYKYQTPTWFTSLHLDLSRPRMVPPIYYIETASGPQLVLQVERPPNESQYTFKGCQRRRSFTLATIMVRMVFFTKSDMQLPQLNFNS